MSPLSIFNTTCEENDELLFEDDRKRSQIQVPPTYNLGEPRAKRQFFIAYVTLSHWHENVCVLSKAETRKLVFLVLLCNGYDPEDTALGISKSSDFSYRSWLHRQKHVVFTSSVAAVSKRGTLQAHDYATLYQRYKPLVRSILNPPDHDYDRRTLC